MDRIAYSATLQHSLLTGERQLFEEDLEISFSMAQERNSMESKRTQPPRGLPPPATKKFRQKKSHDAVNKRAMTGTEIAESAAKRKRTTRRGPASATGSGTNTSGMHQDTPAATTQKRGRGRPRKSNIDANAATKELTTAVSAPAGQQPLISTEGGNPDVSTVKKQGRPAKVQPECETPKGLTAAVVQCAKSQTASSGAAVDECNEEQYKPRVFRTRGKRAPGFYRT
jgi:hypothetical protein